ncbi:hypothetical protein KGP36_00365 [Patescibacteria group bacterium]|nr:hypothetical protein [Patescibacteria group bacterium]MDE1941188.1 hypothetical protein [Patescibacteria group bacterium]
MNVIRDRNRVGKHIEADCTDESTLFWIIHNNKIAILSMNLVASIRRSFGTVHWRLYLKDFRGLKVPMSVRPVIDKLQTIFEMRSAEAERMEVCITTPLVPPGGAICCILYARRFDKKKVIEDYPLACWFESDLWR